MLEFTAPYKRSRLRASDLDRHQTVELLRQHAGEGRLTTDELEERIELAFAATTLGDLAMVTGDLPADPRAVAGLRPPRTMIGRAARPPNWRLFRLVRRVVTIDLAMVLIWLFTGRHLAIFGYVVLATWLVLLFTVSRLFERRHFDRARTQTARGGLTGSRR